MSLRLRVANSGTGSGYATATLVGRRDGTQVYSKSISVTASPGETQSYSFPGYKAESTGVITWTVTIADPTPDKATATTTVYRSYQREED